MRIVLLLCWFTGISTCVIAQTPYAVQPDAQHITTFPFIQYPGGEILIEAKFDTISTPFYFVLDTGSGGISLDSATCSEFKIRTQETDTTIAGIGGVRKVHYVFDRSLSFPGLKMDSLNFHINNYEMLSAVYGQKIDGIIGYSFFSQYIVKINYDSLQIEVYSIGKMKYPQGSHTLHPAFTSLPVQYVKLQDRRKIGYNFYFDTGAGLCLLLNKRFATDSSVLKKKRRPVVTSAEGLLGSTPMKLTVIKKMKLGKYTFRQVPTYIYDDEYNVTSYPFTAGLIGSEIFRRFNLIINYSAREINLLPNRFFNEPFDYSYTGMRMYLIDNKILIQEIVPGSPAEKSGLRVDDEVVAVGNNFTYNIRSLRHDLQEANSNIRMIIRRNGELENVMLKTGSIR